MTKYGKSPWLDHYPKSRVPAYPRYRGPMTTSAVIIGGGLTGCTTAYAFAAAGVKTVLLEADQIGRGATAFVSGWISEDPGVPFAAVEQALGLRAARHGFQAWRRAALDFASLLRRLDVKCRLDECGSVKVALSSDQAAKLQRDHKARRAAGLETPLLSARAIASEFALEGTAALRSRAGAILDPYRACIGLAAAAADRGALLFERSPVRKVTFNRKTAEVITESGAIRTNRVVVATGIPTALYKSLARHFWFRTTYHALTGAVPAKIRQRLGQRAAVVRDMAEPPHVFRWIDDERLLVGGADGETPPPRLREKTIVQRTGQLMYELSTLYPDISGIQPEYGWATDYASTAEGLPYLGVHRNFPHHLFAFGDSSRSVTGAYVASRVFLRQHSGEMDPADEAFGFNR